MQVTAIYSFMPPGYEEITLITFGFLFLIFELFYVSYGLLAFFGLSSLALGFYHIYSSPAVLAPYKQSIILGLTVAFVITFSFFFWWLRKESQKKHRRDFFELEGKTAVVSSELQGKTPPFHYQVKIHGEIWQAVSESPLQILDEVTIIKQKADSLILEIKPRG